jgi:hypothetical protein
MVAGFCLELDNFLSGADFLAGDLDATLMSR